MNHQRVDSSNIYSLAHEGDNLEARFQCGACRGEGRVKLTVGNAVTTSPCPKCSGTGHTGTYVYEGVPAATFHKVLAGEPVENAEPSVGVAFNLYVKQKYKGVKKA